MKKLLSLALAMMMILATLTAVFSINGFATDDEDGVIAPDKSWYDASKTEYELADAADLLGFILLLEGEKDAEGNVTAEPVAFEGKTVKLTANIDVNPGWNAAQYYADITATGEGADMIVPIVPANEWTIHGGTVQSAAKFKGTFDGQNHYIAGIYWTKSTRDSGLFGRVLESEHTIIKNVAFLNSYVCMNEWRQGAIMGSVYANSTLTMENIYSEIIEDSVAAAPCCHCLSTADSAHMPAELMSACAAYQQPAERIFAGVATIADRSFAGCFAPAHFLLHHVEEFLLDDGWMGSLREVHRCLAGVLHSVFRQHVGLVCLAEYGIARVLFVCKYALDDTV